MKKFWSNYKYRFTPWLLFSLKNRACRVVDSSKSNNQVVKDSQCIVDLLHYFKFLHLNIATDSQKINYKHYKEFGFSLCVQPSEIESAGFGVHISQGVAKQGTLVALYPGLIYEPGDPILLPSINNSYVFRCQDGILIDGKGHGMSGYMYESCVLRNGRWGETGYLTADLSWKIVTKSFKEKEIELKSIFNLRSIGQIVNNENSQWPANVIYQEVPLSYRDVPAAQRQFIPYAYYSSDARSTVKLLALYTLRDVNEGEELLSNYFTMIF